MLLGPMSQAELAATHLVNAFALLVVAFLIEFALWSRHGGRLREAYDEDTLPICQIVTADGLVAGTFLFTLLTASHSVRMQPATGAVAVTAQTLVLCIGGLTLPAVAMYATTAYVGIGVQSRVPS